MSDKTWGNFLASGSPFRLLLRYLPIAPGDCWFDYHRGGFVYAGLMPFCRVKDDMVLQ